MSQHAKIVDRPSFSLLPATLQGNCSSPHLNLEGVKKSLNSQNPHLEVRRYDHNVLDRLGGHRRSEGRCDRRWH